MMSGNILTSSCHFYKKIKIKRAPSSFFFPSFLCKIGEENMLKNSLKFMAFFHGCILLLWRKLPRNHFSSSSSSYQRFHSLPTIFLYRLHPKWKNGYSLSSMFFFLYYSFFIKRKMYLLAWFSPCLYIFLRKRGSHFYDDDDVSL